MPAAFREANVAVTELLMERMEKAKVAPRFVYVSSQAAAGPSIEGKPVNESDTPRPIEAYGESKLAAEQAVLRRAVLAKGRRRRNKRCAAERDSETSTPQQGSPEHKGAST